MKEIMAISLTIFDSIYDNKTEKRMDYNAWSEFETVLYRLASQDKYKAKTDAPLISPAVYKDDTTRANDNVTGWGGWAAVDIDDYDGLQSDIEKDYPEKYKYICYSTASSTPTNPKFRMVFPLTDFVIKEDIKHFWYALNKEIGDVADAQTKDLSRMYYVPSLYQGANNFIFSHDGAIMNPRQIMDKHKYVKPNQTMFDKFPEPIQKALMERKKNQLNNTNFTWTTYSDCPFVNQRQIEEYKSISGTGWYSKMYQIMVSTAGNAMSKGYPITAKEIAYICRELDNDTGNWYLKRDMEREAERAIEFVFKNQIIG